MRKTWGMQRPAAPRRGRWSQAEINRLRELYGFRDESAIAHELNRPEASVRKMAEEIFGAPTRTGPWSVAEILELRRYIGGTSYEVIARKLGRSAEEVAQQIEEMRKVQQEGRWTQEEIAEFKRLYGTRTDEDLALIFGRTLQSVQRLGERYRLAKDKAFVRKLTGSAATRMPKSILVYVDGRCRFSTSGEPECYRGSFYADSPRKGGVQASKWWLELMDEVDRRYRTMPSSTVEFTE